MGVILFFVLSGFLITHLLLIEKKNSAISIKKFYIRRILRIWPLYFLILLLAFFILPRLSLFYIPNSNDTLHDNFISKFLYFLFFLPNIAVIRLAPVNFAAQAWSIGVEEQFYLIWPWIIKNVKKLALFFIIFILLFNSLEFILYYLASHFTNTFKYFLFFTTNKQGFITNWLSFFKSSYFNWVRLKDVFNIDCMAIGGLGALLYNSKPNTLLNILYNTYFQLAIYLITIIMLALGFHVAHFTSEIYAILFIIIILNLATNKKTIVNIDYPIFNYLGKISYGLYMYHFIGIVITIKFTHYFLGSYNNVALYGLSFIISILIAGVSYAFFEKPFIKMKVKYSEIVSGDNVS